MSAPLVDVRGVTKAYDALRPLRLESLTVDDGALVSLLGLDAAAAEMLVGLLTGAVLPDAGDVCLFGQSTRDVSDSDAWLKMLDRVGLLTDRAVLIAQFSVEQNIAIPFTLEVDPVAPAVRPQVAALAREVGIDGRHLQAPVAQSPPDVVARVRLARALALGPALLVAEHPTASLPRPAVKPFAADLARLPQARGMAVLTLTADAEFAAALGGEVLTHEPATGALRARSRWRKIFG